MSEGQAPLTTMWEVVVPAGRVDDAIAWVLDRVAGDAQVYRGTEQPIVVVIDPTGQAGTQLADLPIDFAVKPASSWDFERVRNV